MCIVIDENAIGKVFDRRNAQHERFKPVKDWVTTGTGSVIYGGTKYLKELGKGKYLGIFAELLRMRRAINVDKQAVDDRALELKAEVPDKDFDDEHIVALVGISRCCVVCTDDKRSIPYLRRQDLYPTGVKVPHIYRALADKKYCCMKMIVEICAARATSIRRRRRKPKSRPKLDTDTLLQRRSR
jgi:hypothetical protein